MKRKFFERIDTEGGLINSWIAYSPGVGLQVMWPWFWGPVGLQFSWRKRVRAHFVSHWRDCNFYDTPSLRVPPYPPRVPGHVLDGDFSYKGKRK